MIDEKNETEVQECQWCHERPGADFKTAAGEKVYTCLNNKCYFSGFPLPISVWNRIVIKPGPDPIPCKNFRLSGAKLEEPE